ncbi:helix-turn-helix domain-containing protein, partial [Lactococcus lactis]
ELKHQFFKNSIFYKAARIITDSKYCKICELSNKLNYSISYCYKLISTINNLFDDISLEIQFNIKKNTIYIEGELTDIILFRYFLYIIS